MKDEERFRIQFFKTNGKKIIGCTGKQEASYINAIREETSAKRFNKRYYNKEGRFVYSSPMTLDKIRQFLKEKRNTFLYFGKDRMVVGIFLMDESGYVLFVATEKERSISIFQRYNNK
ncbi:hypothetical protein KKB69_00855 [Patescibacteria group bacterium]|nr:hypothetical protein [Patescibacteria group bacterium]